MIPTPQQIDSDIPARFKEFRTWQWQGIQDVVASIKRGTKVTFLDAPTGSGKTLAGVATRSLAFPADSVPYLCTTKSLQDQILREFPFAKVLKGRANYPTRHRGDMWPAVSCDDCEPKNTKLDDLTPDLIEDMTMNGPEILSINNAGERYMRNCGLCGPVALCPYIIARDEAVNAPLCVTNMAYFLLEANGPGKLSDRRLIIVDEADDFETTILSTFTVEIPQWIMDWPGYPIAETQQGPDVDAWIEAMRTFVNGISRIVNTEAYKDQHGAKKTRGRRKTLDRLTTNLAIANSEDWVYEGPSRRSRKTYRYTTLRPVVIGDWVHPYVWNHSTQWLLMSASFVSMDLEALNLGLKPSDIEKVRIDFSFDVKRRPIRYWPADYPYTNAEQRSGRPVLNSMASKIEKICNWYPDERILVHTFSHERTKDLYKLINLGDRPVFFFLNAHDRDAAIRNYLDTPGSVLLAAGLTRGYDFKGDDCRVCIIAKTPFADISDRVVSERLRRGPIGQAWFNLMTVRNMVQMVGRGMRAEDDWLVTYLLDRSFESFLRGAKRSYVPPEFKAAFVDGVPTKGEKVDKTVTG